MTEQELPRHRVALADGWGLWKRFCLRSAGFPEGEVLKLAQPETARAIDRLLALDEEVERCRRAAIASLQRALVGAKSESHDALKRVNKLLDLLRSGHTVEPERGAESFAPVLAAAHAAAKQAQAARASALESFASEQAGVRKALREVAASERFREAVTWQNRAVIASGIDWLLRQPVDATDSLTRKNERLVASYLERYSVKAETIGFFGPIGWGAVDGSVAGVRVRPGKGLLAERKVFLEFWAVDALAQALAQRPGVRPWLPPRRMPTVRLDGLTARLADGRAVELPEDAARVLAACDGVRPAREIAREMAAAPSPLDEPRTFALLADLVERGLATWTLEVPVGDNHPERLLARLLEQIGDEAVRAPALAALGELEARRAAVARAAGDSAALGRAIDEANQAFTRMTAMGAVRRGGRTYAGRTILFEDCRRDVEVVLGQDLIDQLAPPLSLLLTMVRWYTHQATTRLLGYFRGVYEKLRAAGGSDRVPFPTFWKVAEGETLGGNLVAEVAPSSVVRGVVDEFQARLMEVLALSADPRRVQHRAAELAPKVRATFAAPHSGGLPMRFHSPDILIAADGSEAIARGDYQFVVGETHAGTHTFCTPLFLELCPDAAELLRDRATDLPGFEVFPIMSRDRYLRVNPSSYGRDFHVETGDARSWLPRDRVFAAADLVVESIGDQPFVRRSGDPRAFDLVTFLDYYMVRVLVSECRWVAPLPHTPRVTIDRLVIVREAWRFEAPELPFAHGDHGFPRFVEARRWAAKHAMPRFVFVKVPEERKPVYVDFESALCVEQLAHLFRGASSAQVTEMLPAVGQSWLTDAEGNRYVSELRMAAVDPAYPAQRVLGVE